ncbi:MAG: cation transporter [Salinivirgaceae bacterium]|nr:MAG: cation transporter [Salinivirgaceae bacterium]
MSNHNHSHTGNIRFAFFLNILFTIVEIIGGFLTNSVAILADAVHDLGDSLSLGAAWFFEKYSKKPKNKTYTYGYKRFSLIGALINAVVLIGGTVYVLTEIVDRLFEPSEVMAEGMIWLAVAGVAMNGLAVLRLKGNSSLNSRMVMLHLLEDVLGWIAVLIAAITIYFTNWHSIDAWLSLAISIWVLYNAIRGLVEVMKVILQATPKEFDYKKVRKQLSEIKNLEDVHDIHVWSLDGEYHVASMHAVVGEKVVDQQQSEIKKAIREIFKNWDINHVTIEVENDSEQEDCEYHDC